jgi:hypothetical protein
MAETGHRSLLEIVESLPAHPTTGQILGALVRAERAGYDRGLREAARRERATATVTEVASSERSAL